jgi:hypothetical protein
MRDLGRRFALGDLMRRFARTVGRTSLLRELGPYAAIAMVLPGGTLIALAAWTFRHRPTLTAHLGRLLVVVAACGAALILPATA